MGDKRKRRKGATSRHKRARRDLVVAIGAHPDDVEIGCGGALVAHAQRGDTILIVTMSSGERGGDPEVRCAEAQAAAALLGAELQILGLPDGALGRPGTLIRRLEKALRGRTPSRVYTHQPDDSHQDHRATFDAARVAVRGCPSVLLFESPSSARIDRGTHIDISGTMAGKLALIECHGSQAHRPYMTPDVVSAEATCHGARVGTVFAEMFVPLVHRLDVERPTPMRLSDSAMARQAPQASAKRTSSVALRADHGDAA